jgi:hypothetical protein
MSNEDATSSAPSPGFEGPEKVLEIDFTPGLGPARGLREITRAQWDVILTEARCTILNSLGNERLDSYVLSESSLFVYPLKMMLKTCGTTTLLRAIGPLLEVTEVRPTEEEGKPGISFSPPCSHATRASFPPSIRPRRRSA